MIECIFTIDYEIYGNGTGALRDLVYQPARQLSELFRKWNGHFVNFVEVAVVSDAKRAVWVIINEDDVSINAGHLRQQDEKRILFATAV